MSLTINETFRVDASADRAFAFLTNPAEVVTCLPGAELLDTIDERTYAGRVKVKVGPIATAYAGKATLTEVDAPARRVVIVGEGKESGGAGSARMTLHGQVTPLPDGGSEVSVNASIDIAGRVMQFGRGLIESVNKQLFKQFVDAMQAKLAAPPSSNVEDAVPNDIEMHGTAAGETQPLTTGRAPEGTTSGTPDVAPSVVSGVTPAATPHAATPSPIARFPDPGPTAVPSRPKAGAPIAGGGELRVLPLLWRSLLDWLRTLFRRR